MCVVIDMNIFSAVFSPKHLLHRDFVPIRNWVSAGNGKVVFGGTKYASELERLPSALKFVTELDRQRKVVRLDKQQVDREEARVRVIEQAADFDDPHLVAIFSVSACRLLCSHDKPAAKYVKQRRFYSKNHPLPSVYKRREHMPLIKKCPFAACCK